MEQAFVDLAMQHKWVALAAMAIGLIVRMLKSDGPIPVNIPAQYRPWVAVGLGIAAGVLDKAAAGVQWTNAILGGVFAAFAAITGHELLVESIRKGREVGETKKAFEKRSLPPPPPAPEEPKAS